MALRSLGKPGLDNRQSAIIATMYQRTSLAPQVNEGFGVRDQVMDAMASEMKAASRNAISAKGFELEARRVAKLMRAHNRSEISRRVAFEQTYEVQR